jgi:hypothetical protein
MRNGNTMGKVTPVIPAGTSISLSGAGQPSHYRTRPDKPGDTKEMTLSPWLALEFVALAGVFSMVGVFEGLVFVIF